MVYNGEVYRQGIQVRANQETGTIHLDENRDVDQEHLT